LGGERCGTLGASARLGRIITISQTKCYSDTAYPPIPTPYYGKVLSTHIHTSAKTVL